MGQMRVASKHRELKFKKQGFCITGLRHIWFLFSIEVEILAVDKKRRRQKVPVEKIV